MKEVYNYDHYSEDAELLRITSELVQLIKAEGELALRIGRLLLQIKPRLRHGDFQPWCRVTLGIEPRRAENWMEYARGVRFLGAETASKLSAACVRVLKTAPTEVTREVLQAVEQGAVVTAVDVRQRIANVPVECVPKNISKLTAQLMSVDREIIADLSQFLAIANLAQVRALSAQLRDFSTAPLPAVEFCGATAQ
jgi:hypothetical protein